MPCANTVARSCVRSAANAVDAISGLSRPPGSLIYSDFMSGLGGADQLLNIALLGPQYQDGVLVGLQPACDDLAFAGLPGVRGMRTMGQITNILPTGTDVLTDNSKWSIITNMQRNAVDSGYYRLTNTAINNASISAASFAVTASVYFVSWTVRRVNADWILVYTNSAGYWFNITTGVVGSSFGSATSPHIRNNGDGSWTVGFATPSLSSLQPGCPKAVAANGATQPSVMSLSVDAKLPIIAATSYPVPYVPPGTTQTSTAHNGTSGVHYAMPQNGAIWNQLSLARPFTLAARIVPGVGSTEIPNNTTLNIRTCRSDQNRLLRIVKDSSGNCRVELNDGTNTAQSPIITWTRYQPLVVIGQVLAGGLQMRAGAKVGSGAFSFGSAVTYAGTFGPDAVYSKLMLAHSNVYPIHTLKDWLADYQASDSDILSAMGVAA